LSARRLYYNFFKRLGNTADGIVRGVGHRGLARAISLIPRLILRNSGILKLKLLDFILLEYLNGVFAMSLARWAGEPTFNRDLTENELQYNTVLMWAQRWKCVEDVTEPGYQLHDAHPSSLKIHINLTRLQHVISLARSHATGENLNFSISIWW